MDEKIAIAALKRHEAEPRNLGVVGLSFFGSTARSEVTEDSDIDLAVTLRISCTALPTSDALIGPSV